MQLSLDTYFFFFFFFYHITPHRAYCHGRGVHCAGTHGLQLNTRIVPSTHYSLPLAFATTLPPIWVFLTACYFRLSVSPPCATTYGTILQSNRSLALFHFRQSPNPSIAMSGPSASRCSIFCPTFLPVCTRMPHGYQFPSLPPHSDSSRIPPFLSFPSNLIPINIARTGTSYAIRDRERLAIVLTKRRPATAMLLDMLC